VVKIVVNFNKYSREVMRKTLYVVFFIFLLYLIFELARKILGGSLGFEELVIGLLVANLGYSFYIKEALGKIDSKISGHIGWHRGVDARKR
jgi:ABC-type methionine transport system permease subunit